MLKLTIVSPGNPLMSSAPGGLGYLSEIFHAARLKDGLTANQTPDAWLARSLARLKRRYPGRIQARWVDPHSLLGMVLVLRFRIRKFPIMIIDGELLDPGEDPRAFEETIAVILARPAR